MISLVPWVWLYLLPRYNESCVIIFAFRAKLSHFLAFLQFHLCTSIPGMLPVIFCVHSQSLKAVFALSGIKVFCLTKFICHNSQWKHMTHEHLRSNQTEDELKSLWLVSLWVTAVLAISPPFLNWCFNKNLKVISCCCGSGFFVVVFSVWQDSNPIQSPNLGF